MKDKKHSMKKLFIIMLMMTLCLAFAGCGGNDGVLNPDADKEGVTDDSWSKDVWDSAVQDMIQKGYATANDEDGVIFVCDNNGEIVLSEEGKAALMSPDFKIDGKVIWGGQYATMSETSTPDIEKSKVSGSDEEGEDVFSYVSPFAEEATSDDVFAESRGRCKYLILETALCYNIKREYYIGGVDRLDISTYVFVIDAVSKEVVHIEYLGSDSPGAVASSYMGHIYAEEAHAYMNKICQE